MKSPAVMHVNVERSAYHGINVVSPTHTVCETHLYAKKRKTE